MITTRQIIERLTQLEKEHGRPLVVAIENGEELPDIIEIRTAIDTGQTGETIVVLIPDMDY